jgi:transcriptional regulator with XRE-family HTH domain
MAKCDDRLTGNLAEQLKLWALIGRRLQSRRAQLELNENVVAKKLGIPRPTYEAYEAGLAKTPPKMLGRLAELFEVPVAWFFQEEATDEDADWDEQPAGGAVFAVATATEREEALIAYFHRMDLDQQRHLLSIARVMCPKGND